MGYLNDLGNYNISRIYMNKKDKLKTLLVKSINRLNVIKVKYHYVVMNEKINEIMKDKRITNKKLIEILKKNEADMERMEDEIRFLTQ
tara:strand:+ start:14803 stop:15066 length:264 start_codon:yes stop_codon:yes gene_type:complete